LYSFAPPGAATSISEPFFFPIIVHVLVKKGDGRAEGIVSPEQLTVVPPAQSLWRRGYSPTTFAKPSSNFTNFLPSLFGLPSIPWLKTDAGPRDGETKNSEASNGTTCPDVAPNSIGNRRIKNFAARSGS
jgi:hypothetical protein